MPTTDIVNVRLCVAGLKTSSHRRDRTQLACSVQLSSVHFMRTGLNRWLYAELQMVKTPTTFSCIKCT